LIGVTRPNPIHDILVSPYGLHPLQSAGHPQIYWKKKFMGSDRSRLKPSLGFRLKNVNSPNFNHEPIMKIAVAKGDGIGPEIMDAVLHIFNANQVPLEYEMVDMGKWVFDKGFSNGMTPESQQVIEELGILFKGPMETPKGKGVKSINVTARKTWNTYANKRVFQSLHGVDTVFSKAGIPIDITIVRENIEDTYGGIEHMPTHDVALSRRFITRPGSLQVIRYAFEMAKKNGSRRVTCGHKANIMKLTDGLFLECFQEVAREYPELKSDDIIVDDLAMKLVIRPQDFDVVVLTNLQGDIISDLCAGLVGGLGFAPSANIGDHISIFEAVHGTAPDIAGKNIANPTALLLSGVAMLRHLGLMQNAAVIENALLYTLEQGVHTGDFGDKKIPGKNTTDFAQAIINHFGKTPEHGAKPVMPNKHVTPTVFKMDQNQMMVSVDESVIKEYIVGVDMFIESDGQPEFIAKKCLRHGGVKFKLINISNRGTQVWPTGSVYTNLVNQYNARFESIDGSPLVQQDIIGLYVSLSGDFKIGSLELLNVMDGKKAYSLAQGQ
jgi:isocitrate dehydrogenase